VVKKSKSDIFCTPLDVYLIASNKRAWDKSAYGKLLEMLIYARLSQNTAKSRLT